MGKISELDIKKLELQLQKAKMKMDQKKEKDSKKEAKKAAKTAAKAMKVGKMYSAMAVALILVILISEVYDVDKIEEI